ncbi:protein-glutamate O-methyltransferase CheR [Herbaspirillum huttiense F1]|uniref:CheR family methyltransferase n=1 Tax=Herbaspirillum huttiense TaxID=863372 RepID=UPI002883EE22|nr:protein-glutamate O-methyltransferase CheR [Herbaspirillum huttiense]MDT0355919.1 protein-glutamate O-methyltransferase CheR [Herbaspirillum huttiense F1]
MNVSAEASTSSISAEDFERFREYFYRRSGIHFESTKRYFVDKRLIDRIQAAGCADFREYFSLLRFETSGREWQRLVNEMTVNETYFMREHYQFDCMVQSMLPELVARKPRGEPMRIWIMPSSSGEEAYTVAMYLLERWPELARWDVEIVSSDIDTRILAQAEAGLYSPRAVHQLPAAWLQKYFTREGENWRINRSLREVVAFTRVNLNERAEVAAYRNYDLVFCRNLLIYFDDASRRRAAEAFYDVLRPGGFICLGHSESMSRISSLFAIRKFAQAIVYQKPLEQA